VSYTLTGRIHSRLAALLPVLVTACALAVVEQAWWPVELAAIMAAAGVLLDVLLYDRLLDYQAGWLAVPLGGFELALVMILATELGVGAPRTPAIALFVAGWVVAQLAVHAVLPLRRLAYAEEGGELGRAGTLAAAGVAIVLVAAGALAWSLQPPTVHLAAGVVDGPLEITRSQVLEGEPGTVVRGGIVIRADDVTVRGLEIVGGENGIDVDDADGVTIDGVTISGSSLDGIHARRSSVTIRDCSIDSSASLFGQGIDISYSFDRKPSSVTGCTVVGGQEGIVTHFANASIARNRVSGTSLRAISMTEMSMGMIEHNEVHDAHGVGILCNDHSMCEIERNVVARTTADHASGNLWRLGFGVLVSYNSEAHFRGNELQANPHPMRAVLGSELHGADADE
jgi:Right handed beta helix region